MAGLSGAAKRHAGWRVLSADETAAAVAELHDIAGGRRDLLAEVAGVLIGFHEGDLDEPRANGAAELCRLAGADETLIPRWIEVGRDRAEAAKRPPFSGGLRRR